MTIEKGFRLVQQIIKILLFCSIGVVISSCLLTLFIGSLDAFPVNFCAAYFSIYVLFLSVIGLTCIALYRINIRDKIWANIRKEVLLLFASISSMSLLGLITSFVN